MNVWTCIAIVAPFVIFSAAMYESIKTVQQRKTFEAYYKAHNDLRTMKTPAQLYRLAEGEKGYDPRNP